MQYHTTLQHAVPCNRQKLVFDKLQLSSQLHNLCLPRRNGNVVLLDLCVQFQISDTLHIALLVGGDKLAFQRRNLRLQNGRRLGQKSNLCTRRQYRSCTVSVKEKNDKCRKSMTKFLEQRHLTLHTVLFTHSQH